MDTDLLEAGLMDSLTFVELAVQVEQTFGVTISANDLEIDHFRTVASIASFVLAQRTQDNGSCSGI